MKTRIGTVWDSTIEVINGRLSILLGIAVLAFFLPAVVQNAVIAFAPATPGTGLIVTLASAIVTLWGQLAVIAVATDPATDAAAGWRQATPRLLPAIGVQLLVGLVAIVALLPLVGIMLGSGMTFTAASLANPALMGRPSPGAALGIGLYGLAVFIGGLIVGVRLLPLNAVIFNERLGVGAIVRSVRLTRGLTWKLIGALLLFLIVYGVATSATQAVIGVVLRVLGAGKSTAIFLAGVAAAAVSTALVTLGYVFAARLYMSATGRAEDVRLSTTFE